MINKNNKGSIKIFLVILLLALIIATGILVFNLTGRAVSNHETIKLGITTALSGNYAYIGKEILRGVQEAINNKNKKGNLPQIELIVEDNQADTKTAVTSYQTLKANGARVIFSSFSTITEALSPLANQDKNILMYNAVSTSAAEKYEYVFKVYSNAPDEVKAMLGGIEKTSGKNALVYVNNPTSAYMRQIILTELPEIEEYKFELTDNDFRTIILKLKEKNVKNIMLNAHPKQILSFISQSIELDYKLEKIFVVSDGGSAEVVDNVESIIGNSEIEYILVGYGPQSKQIYYVFAHDLAKVLIEGMEKCEKLGKSADDTECLKIELKKIKTEGKSGTIDMVNSRIAQLYPKLYTVKNKELVLYA